jgi:carboxyl-terminal processing protease
MNDPLPIAPRTAAVAAPPTDPWSAPPAARPARSFAALVLLVVVFTIGVAVGSTGVLGRVAGSANAQPTPKPNASAGASSVPGGASGLVNLDLLNEALGVIQQNFVGRADLDPTTLTYGAIRGLVESLGDTSHTVFLTPQQAQDEQNALDQSVVGIGVLVGTKDNQTIIVSVIPDSPAQQAGLKAGDAIVAIDGQNTQDLTPDELVQRVRGDEGTTVTITIARPSTSEQLEFTITREKIKFPSTAWTMVPGTNIADIRLSQFAAGSSDELLATRDAALAAGATSIVLDLRGNPGGYVDQAVRSASEFLHGQTVYIRELADGSRIPVMTDDSIASTDVPLVVLVDNNTASSAEIMSGALQSAGRAQLVGETTFGTGTVLLPYPLSDGSVIRLAIERWLTPTGELIFGKGITPNEVVALGPDDVPLEPDDVRELTPDALAASTDRQLLTAIALAGGPPYSPPPAPSGQPIPSSEPSATP